MTDRSTRPPTRRLVLAGGLAATVAPAPEPASAHGAVPPPFLLKPWMTLADVPGASWALLDGDRIDSHAEGDARAGVTPATVDTVFEAASLSKPVLAAAIHALVAEGRIDLDAPVVAHIPFTRDAATRAVTPRHLLAHAGGLLNWRTEPGDLVSSFTPGSAFRYSGEGYALLARLAETITGESAAALVRRLVLVPAGMTRSGYGWIGDGGAVAWPHDAGGAVMTDKGPAAFRTARDAGPARSVERWTEADRVAAAQALGKPALPLFLIPNMAAGLWTTAGDYARFLRFARRFPAMNTPTVRVAGALSWGLGWGLEQAGARRFAWHWGQNDGVCNLFVTDLSAGTSLVVLTNGAGGQRVYGRAARVRFAREFDALTWLQP
ncbi:serine hydrolase domain-containing protein [Sphingomonas sp. RIT328]|uniref:serine hydrolase domain-containing protein n=1 Tax=Sphingomonas sp. RIT328 TaxID=1470591 RepID=UPI00044A7F8A|nr:serine hydrolase domain-containing protein [Sphingomonas sp. RIT328]EZP55795.1 Beta-lactamase precursor [Sphingomonas sp. RIT328]